MAVALGTLRWTPDTFWRATPREVAAAFAALGGGRGPPGPGDLAALLAAFPDQPHDDGATHA